MDDYIYERFYERLEEAIAALYHDLDNADMDLDKERFQGSFDAIAERYFD